MVKQRLEGHFRDAIKNDERLWYLKLQVNPMAHCVSPADFIVLSEEYRYLVECKECSNERFDFSRLTQLIDLVDFNKKHINNLSYVLISFWKGSRKKSHYFLIQITEFLDFMVDLKKKSANLKDFLRQFNRIDINKINEVF